MKIIVKNHYKNDKEKITLSFQKQIPFGRYVVVFGSKKRELKGCPALARAVQLGRKIERVRAEISRQSSRMAAKGNSQKIAMQVHLQHHRKSRLKAELGRVVERASAAFGKDRVQLGSVDPRGTSSTCPRCGHQFIRTPQNWDVAFCPKRKKKMNIHVVVGVPGRIISRNGKKFQE
ncbi:MAG: transposase family protein [Candidatus Helarchaeales archaeon]